MIEHANTEHANVNDLLAFISVAREGSFTHAAKKLGVPQSALSHNIRALETRLGIKLLMRTTRSVRPTDAGEHLLQTVAPRFDDIAGELAALSKLHSKPAGTVRITCAEHAASEVLWPKLSAVLSDYPDIRVDLNVDYGVSNIVTQKYDAGVRLGDQVDDDMVAVRIGPDMRMAVVAAPVYFDERPQPVVPRDLQEHNCINLRSPAHGKLLAWEFEKDGVAVNVRVKGQWVFNSSAPRLRAALAGAGLAYLPEDMVREPIADGRLVQVLQDWCPSFPGYHLYYPSRRPASSAFGVVVEALRHRAEAEADTDAAQAQ